MRKHRAAIALSCLILTLAVFAWAQAIRKPGLWEMTSTTTWQKTPLPPGMTLPPGAGDPFAPTTRTSTVCLTQEMIDKYGAPIPTNNSDCAISNVVLKTSSMTADMVCTGRMNTKATLESSWDGNIAHGKVHFVGTMQMRQSSVPVEFTVTTTSVYKGAECGSVKPLAMPSK
jgi:hypothetical protein